MVAILVGGLMIGAPAASYAQTVKPAAKPEAAKPDPAKVALEKAMDKAVANYNKNKAEKKK
jgi:hypothetical protein